MDMCDLAKQRKEAGLFKVFEIQDPPPDMTYSRFSTPVCADIFTEEKQKDDDEALRSDAPSSSKLLGAPPQSDELASMLGVSGNLTAPLLATAQSQIPVAMAVPMHEFLKGQPALAQTQAGTPGMAPFYQSSSGAFSMPTHTMLCCLPVRIN